MICVTAVKLNIFLCIVTLKNKCDFLLDSLFIQTDFNSDLEFMI